MKEPKTVSDFRWQVARPGDDTGEVVVSVSALVGGEKRTGEIVVTNILLEDTMAAHDTILEYLFVSQQPDRADII